MSAESLLDYNRRIVHQNLIDIARREVAQALIEMPEDLELPKSAIIELMIQAFVRGVSWQQGVDR